MSRVDSSTLLFFDASCLIAAAASPNGGAGFLWELCERGFLQGAVSQAVLAETEANLIHKFDAFVLERHRRQLQSGAPVIAPIPRLDVHPRRYPHINPKDEHVVAAAEAIRADFILTLDQPLAREIALEQGIPARLPGEFIRNELPQHPFYSRLR